MAQSSAMTLKDQHERGISTFVFFDLESTGLGGNGKQPRITEMSLVAVHRDNLQDPCPNDTPRVLNKLSLCVYPMKVVEHGASLITGLYNDNLLYQKDFDDGMSSMLDLFIQRQAPPVCLIAHNGFKFDFPLLKAELRKLGKDLADDVLCADSLEAYQSLDEQSQSYKHNKIKIDLASNSKKVGSIGNIQNVMFTPIRYESTMNEGNDVGNGIPVPRFYNAQQISNNITPELQTALESWKKEPPPAPCAKRCTSRVTKIPPYEAPTNDVTSVRKRLFEEHFSETDAGTPPPTIGSDTPPSTASRIRMESGQSFKVKKKLFGDGEDEAVKSSIVGNSQTNIQQRNEGTFTPTQDENEETQLYWGGDSIDNSLGTVHIEKANGAWIHNVSDEDEIWDDLLLAAVLQAEEDESQKHMFDNEISRERERLKLNKQTGSENFYPTAATPSTSGAPKAKGSESVSPSKRPRLSYKLIDLHKRIVGYEMHNQHRAEDDCLALVRIFHKDFQRVSTWVDNHAVPFKDISPMYTSKLKTKPCLDQNQFPYEEM